jgi:hypothetical protein
LNYQVSAQNAALNRQKFEMQNNTSEQAQLYLGQYFEFVSDPSNVGKGFMEYMMEPMLDEKGDVLTDESGRPYMIYNQIGQSEAKEVLSMLVQMGRIDGEQESEMDKAIAELIRSSIQGGGG